jgi:hypothetical protein
MFGYGIGQIINVVLIIGTAIGILQPAFSGNVGLTQILISLFDPTFTQEFLMKWLLMLAFLAACYTFIISIVYRNIPITVISTDITVTFLSGDFSEVHIYREQLLRANQPNVTAYFSSHTPSGRGQIPHAQITAAAYCDKAGFQSDFEIFGEDGKKAELFHMFLDGLPYKWYMPLIPIWFLNNEYNKLPRFLRKNLVSRTNKVIYINEFNVEKPVIDFAFITGRYHQHNITINLSFPHTPRPASLRVMRIKNNGVIKISPQIKANGDVLIHSHTIRMETIRITWNNPPQDNPA